MATIDPSIVLSVKPLQLDNPLNAMAMYSQIQGAQQANQLNQMKMAEYERARAEEEGIRNYLAGSADLSAPETRTGLLKYGKTGLEYGKALTEQDKMRVELNEKRVKLATDKTALFRDALADINTPQQAAMWITAQHQDPDLKPIVSRLRPLDQALAAIPTDPKAFADWKAKNALGMSKFIERNTMTEADKQRIGIERQRVGLEDQRVNLEGRRVKLAEEEAQLKREGIEGVSPKDLQKREAAYPQATSVIKGFESKSDNFVKDLKTLRDHPGLNEITGILAGRVGTALSDDGRAALALYNKVAAKGGFQALQDLRDASKTGGALGNVSNQEGKQLAASFAAIDRTQNAKDVRAALDQAIGDVEGAKTRMREAYDTTYAYKAKKAGGGGGDGVDTSNPLLK